jgi:hypothetical protein
MSFWTNQESDFSVQYSLKLSSPLAKILVKVRLIKPSHSKKLKGRIKKIGWITYSIRVPNSFMNPLDLIIASLKIVYESTFIYSIRRYKICVLASVIDHKFKYLDFDNRCDDEKDFCINNTPSQLITNKMLRRTSVHIIKNLNRVGRQKR